MLDARADRVPALALPSLRELHLRRNALHGGPGGGARLRELRLLDLRANRLTAVPDWIAELPRLEKLDLRWNEVSDAARRALLDRGCVVLWA